MRIFPYVGAAILFYLIVSDFRVVEKQSFCQYKTADVRKKADVLLLYKSCELGNDANFESSLYEKCLLNEDIERKDVMEKTQFELRIVVQNLTPVDQETSILYVLDSSYLVSQMICSVKKIPQPDAEMQDEIIAEGKGALQNPKLFKLTLAQIRKMFIVITNFYKIIFILAIIDYAYTTFNGENMAFAAHVAMLTS